MERIYMNRIEGQRRIHIEIDDNEVTDLLDDLKGSPEYYPATRQLLSLLAAAEEVFSPVSAADRKDTAGIRDTARQAAGQPDAEPVVAYWNDFPRSILYCREHGEGRPKLIPRTADDLPFGGNCATCGRDVLIPADQPDPTTADDPTPLRWGLGDVLWGDDDTVIVCLSGPAPDYRPYWLELGPERAAALRDDLTGPDGPPAVDTIGLCGYCGVPRETHHHGYVSTADAIAAAPHRVTAAGQPATQQQTEERRRLAAVERLCSGRPGYHTVTVKELLTAMSEAAR